MTEKLLCPETGHQLSLDELEEANSELQKCVMRHWFYSNYEDPAERTPYESREGGYIYIWGGPYYAHTELSDYFGEHVTEEVIEDLVAELDGHCFEWTSAPSDDDYYSTAIFSNTEFHKTFIESLEKIEDLLKTEVEEHVQQDLRRMLYVNLITALETFLSDAFINTTMHETTLIRKFVENSKWFADQKFPLSELFSKSDSIEKEVKEHLLSQVWHNLSKVIPIYKSTLDIDFPKDLKEIFKAIASRHDIVHRNGKNKEGHELIISKDDIRQLMGEIKALVDHIDNQFPNGAEEITEF